MQRLALIRAGNQHRRVPSRNQDPRQQSNPPLLHLFHPQSRRDPLPIRNHRLPRKQTRRVRIRTHSLMNHVKPRNPVPEHRSNLIHISRRRNLWIQLRQNPMNVRRRKSARLEPSLIGMLEIALLIRRRHTPLIHPEKLHPIPIEIRRGKHLKHRNRRRPSGNRQRRLPLPGKVPQNVPPALLRRVRAPVHRHLSTASNTASGPEMASSARITESRSAAGSTRCEVRGPQHTSTSPLSSAISVTFPLLPDSAMVRIP